MSEGCEWNYNETPDFINSSEELCISDETRTLIKNWALSFGRQTTERSKPYFFSPNNIFEIWVVRTPNPDIKKGTSGGFRLVLFTNLSDHSINLCKLELRNKLGGKKERPRDQQRQTTYLKELKKYLLRELDNFS